MVLPVGYEPRAMTLADLAGVLKVERACYSEPWTRPLFEAELTNEFSQPFVVVDASDTIVGHLVFWIVHDELHLLNIAVKPSCQRRGLASAMLQHLFEVCRQNRLIYVALEVREANTGAQKLYKRFGFAEVGRRRHYYPDTDETAIVMAVVIDET
jgi:ribosomal-protein-alanine N-acetyltransferase